MPNTKPNTTGPAGPKKRRRRVRKRRGPAKASAAAAPVKQIQQLRAEVKQVKKRTEGPTVQKTFPLTLDAGFIAPSASDDLTKCLTLLTNPTLMKAATTGPIRTPLTNEASMYQLWKLTSLVIEGIPMVGGSAVAGSAHVLTMSQDAGSTGEVSVNTLYQKTHHKLTPGKPFRWRIPSRALMGPKQGWYYMNPDREQTTSLGPRIEAWGYGTSVSTFQNTSWNGPLWRLTIRATYQFSSFNPDPNLANLDQGGLKEGSMTVNVDGDGNAVMQIEAASGLSSGPRSGVVTEGLKDVIWAAADAAVGVASAAPGWGWLIKGAWWFLKKIVGKQLRDWLRINQHLLSTNGADVFLVYSSLDDARTGQAWQPPNSSGSTVRWDARDVTWMQLTPEKNQNAETIATEQWPASPWQVQPALMMTGPTVAKQQPAFPWVMTQATFIVRKNNGTITLTYNQGNSTWSAITGTYSVGAVCAGGQYRSYMYGALVPHWGYNLEPNTNAPQVVGDHTSLFKRMMHCFDTGVMDEWMVRGTVNFGTLHAPFVGYYCHMNIYKQAGRTETHGFLVVTKGMAWDVAGSGAATGMRATATVNDYVLTYFNNDTSQFGDQAQVDAEYPGIGHFWSMQVPPGYVRNLVQVDGQCDSGGELQISESEDEEETDLVGAMSSVSLNGPVFHENLENHLLDEISVPRHNIPMRDEWAPCVLCAVKRTHELELCLYMRNEDVDIHETPWRYLYRTQVTPEDRREDWTPILLKTLLN